MSFRLPPPDPFETLGWAPEETFQMHASAAVYLGGHPTPEGKRISSVAGRRAKIELSAQNIEPMPVVGDLEIQVAVVPGPDSHARWGQHP